MAPSAMPDPMPMHRPLSTKGSTISASVLHGPRDLRLEPRILEEPGPGELQVAIRSTGICGSDVSYYQKFANGDLCACAPLSLGHESSGVVVAVGPPSSSPSPSQQQGQEAESDNKKRRINRFRFAVGDRVALEVGVPSCGGRCSICRQGRYNLCKRMRFRSSAKTVPHFQGTLQERINHPAVWCHKLPDHVSFDAAALLEPLSVATHAVNRASPRPGSTALVIGAGTVGLLTAAMARQSGCTTVTISDIDAGRVDYALRKGFATHGFVVPHPSHGHGHSHSHTPNDNPSSNNNSNGDRNTSSFYTNSGRSTPQLLDSGAATPSSMFSSSPSSSSSSSSASSASSIHARLENAKALSADILSVTKPPPSDSSSNGLYEEEDDDNDDDDDDEHAGVDVTFECTGKEVCMHTSLYATRPGGKVIMVGMGTPIQTLPMSVAHLKEVDILGIFRYANTYPTGIRLLCASSSQTRTQEHRRHGMTMATTGVSDSLGGGGAGVGVGMGMGGGLPSLDDMVTHRFKGLGAAKHAFELAGRTVDDDGNLVLKVVIEA